MARPKEKGCRYFPLDVDFYADKKLKRLRAQLGHKAESVLLRIWCQIYSGEGYYVQWCNDDVLELADDMGNEFSATYIGEVITCALNCGIFDNAVFQNVGVLTSAAIQRRYVSIKYRQQVIPIYNDYWACSASDFGEEWEKVLLKLRFFEINGTETAVNVTKTAVNVTKTTPKKSKEKKSKEKQIEEPPFGALIAEFANGDVALESTLHDFVKHRVDMKKPLNDVAITRLFARLNRLAEDAKVHSPNAYMIAALDQSIRARWQDIFTVRDFAEPDTPPAVTVQGSGEDAPRKISADADFASLFGG